MTDTRSLAKTLSEEQARLVDYLEATGQPRGLMIVVLAITMRMVAKSLGAPFQELLELVESTESLGAKGVDHAKDCAGAWAIPTGEA